MRRHDLEPDLDTAVAEDAAGIEDPGGIAGRGGEGLVEQKKNISGPALGVGGHYALNNHFIGRLEYVHYFYGDTTYDIPAPVTVKNSADELRIGLDYKF